MAIQRELKKRSLVNLLLLLYWLPALIVDFVIQLPTTVGVHIYTDFMTNWGQVMVLVHLITSISITATDVEYLGLSESLLLLRDRVTHMAMLFSMLITMNFVAFHFVIFHGLMNDEWTLRNIHEYLVNIIVMFISVVSLKSHFRKRDVWLGKSKLFLSIFTVQIIAYFFSSMAHSWVLAY